MEQMLGRKLARHEHVHHLNGDKTDNRIENLALIPAREHHRQHMLENDFAKRMSIKGHEARWGYRADL
jgi:hypothetical protein